MPMHSFYNIPQKTQAQNINANAQFDCNHASKSQNELNYNEFSHKKNLQKNINIYLPSDAAHDIKVARKKKGRHERPFNIISLPEEEL